MTIESSITFFIAIFIFGITPGPGVFAILARSMLKGAGSCFWLSTGMVISDIVYLIMACLGLATVAATWEELFIAIRIVGAAYLIYLGWKMWTIKVDAMDSTLDEQPHVGGHVASFVQGFLISASNPKVIIFYIAFLPTFMDLALLSSQDVVIASVLTFFALLSGLMLIALGASQARRYLKSEKSIKILNRTAGSIMAGAGFYIGLRS
ncbi:LysE family translocator [Marinomonas sp. 2405UD68-3]|uniref:LysE family translocator n=1 Tax=Marinomonas sp. 2405UD68-3 TaxID=3391835 RepID=UPI0039C9F7D0